MPDRDCVHIICVGEKWSRGRHVTYVASAGTIMTKSTMNIIVILYRLLTPCNLPVLHIIV